MTSRISLLLVVLIGLFAPGAVLVWQACTPMVAVQTSDLGTFVSAEAHPGGIFSPTISSVQTTVGSVSVEGTISAARGQELAIKTLNKRGVQLCVDNDLQACLPLSSTWLGPMFATPQAATATDFQRFGLSTHNMEFWLFCGVWVSLLVFLDAALRRLFEPQYKKGTLRDGRR